MEEIKNKQPTKPTQFGKLDDIWEKVFKLSKTVEVEIIKMLEPEEKALSLLKAGI